MTDNSIASPLSVIDNELLRLFTSGKTSDSQTHLTQLFDHMDETVIPLLTREAITSGSLPANSLVRYRCLVQVGYAMLTEFIMIINGLTILSMILRICLILSTTLVSSKPKMVSCCLPSIEIE